jgi:hypothetical protein
MRCEVSAVLLVLCLAVSAQAATFYVNNAGSPVCSNSVSFGTLVQPWCTITYALAHMTGGDTILVRSGTYNETVQISGPSGTPGSPTIIQVFPGDTVTIRGTGVNTGRCKILNTNNIVFDGFKITNFNEGLYLENVTSSTIQNLEVFAVGQDAITIHFDSSYITAQNCKIHDTHAFASNGEGFYIGSGSFENRNDNTNHIFIRNNLIYNTFDECVELKPGTHDITVENNEMHDCLQNTVYGNDVGSIEADESASALTVWNANPNHIIRNNTVHDTKTGIQLGTGAMAYNNVVYNISSGNNGIYTRNVNGDNYPRVIYHNTLAVPSGSAIANGGSVQVIKNNIGPASTNNLSQDDAYFVSAVGHDYHLVSGAAPINAGSNVGVTTDKEGGARDAQPDYGAYEFGSSLNIPTVCDVNSSGSTNVSDVQLMVNQAIGAATCTADINKDGACNVIDVQRVVNAALGGQCVTN